MPAPTLFASFSPSLPLRSVYLLCLSHVARRADTSAPTLRQEIGLGHIAGPI